MSDFLTAVSTTTVKRPKPVEPLLEASTTSKVKPVIENIDLGLPEEAANALKNQPDLDTVAKLVRLFATGFDNPDGFNLVAPNPISAQIVGTLVVSTIPDYWTSIKGNLKLEKDLTTCLRTPNGLGAILSRLRPLIADCRQKKALEDVRDPSAHIEDLIDVLQEILWHDSTSSKIWEAIRRHAQNDTHRRLMWREFVLQVASGRLLSLVAEAEDVLKERGSEKKPSWAGNGAEYASWLGRNLAVLMQENTADAESRSAVTELLSKALGLGYLGRLVGSITEVLVVEASTATLEKFLPTLKAHEQRKHLNATLAFTAQRYLARVPGTKDDAALQASQQVSAVAALLYDMVKNNELLREHAVTVLTRSSSPALDDSLPTRRSLIAAIAHDDEKLHTVLEKCLRTFGDSFYIKHTPIVQQEALAQTLLLACGYVQRSEPMFMTMMAKSSYHMSGMSNRLKAASLKARFLGMVVGVAISKIVDKPELQLKFDFEGPEEAEADWYQRLPEVDDKLGSVKDLQIQMNRNTQKKDVQKQIQKKKVDDGPAITEITGPRIVEIVDESSEEDDDLNAYDKPDSDPEDDADDPTEVNRNKPTAPVYIRDLIAGLRDHENYDRHELALSTAPSLIRRKANFGTEVTDHLEELASVLVGLQDNFDMPNFIEHRQQALIAVLLAKPAQMAQWFSRAFFSGDFSISQRVAMLTTLGLGARELAGLKDSSTEALIPPPASFPSKALPPNLHKIYSTEANINPVARVSGNVAQQLLSPIAATAADKLSGPDILKVRTFSSRMRVEKQRSKPIPNALAQIVADNFFFPLTGRWWINSRSGGSDSVYTSTHLLPPFLNTLALLLQASGANTLALPQMTREFWELLLSVRGIAEDDKGVLNALLFAFLMLLETNENKERLATEQAKELLETQQWVRLVFENLGAGSEEDEKIRALAAGVLVRCQEVVEKYQRRMVGSMLDY